jgi:hypothetical protein
MRLGQDPVNRAGLTGRTFNGHRSSQTIGVAPPAGGHRSPKESRSFRIFRRPGDNAPRGQRNDRQLRESRGSRARRGVGTTVVRRPRLPCCTSSALTLPPADASTTSAPRRATPDLDARYEGSRTQPRPPLPARYLALQARPPCSPLNGRRERRLNHHAPKLVRDKPAAIQPHPHFHPPGISAVVRGCVQ